MKKIISALTMSLLAVTLYAAPVSKDGNTGIALEGYDPVAFFTQQKAAKGDPKIQLQHEKAIYFFASEENKKTFLAAPEKYLPVYGGYCAFGASIGVLLPVEIETWEIVNGKLVLQYNEDIKQLFKKDTKGNFSKADSFWEKQN